MADLVHLTLDLFNVLLDLLLAELQGIDIRPQLAETLIEDGYLLRNRLVLGSCRQNRYCEHDQNHGKSEKLLVFHGSSLETTGNRCKSRIHCRAISFMTRS